MPAPKGEDISVDVGVVTAVMLEELEELEELVVELLLAVSVAEIEEDDIVDEGWTPKSVAVPASAAEGVLTQLYEAGAG